MGDALYYIAMRVLMPAVRCLLAADMSVRACTAAKARI